MLIKLIEVDSYHFIRYKCKITHCLDSQTLSEYISTIVLHDNEKFLINGVLDVLMGVGTFTSTNSFNTQCPICYSEQVKKVYTRLVTFYFLLGSFIVSTFCWTWKLLHTMRCLQEDKANVSIHSAEILFCRGDTKFTYCCNE